MVRTPDQFDYIVVGAGSAGCVLANRLSADGRHKVLLLEAGPKDNYLWIHIPIGYGKTMFHKAYNWGFYTDPEPNMKDRRIYWPRGRGLGGSSSINGLICIRGQREDYDRWAQLGNPGWDWKSVLPYFIKSEHNSRGASAVHGGDGPLWMSDIGAKSELMEAIIRGAKEMGVPQNDDFNSGDQEGVGYYQLFTHNGWRISSAVAYLKPARNRANLSIETDAHATGLILEGRRAVGVRYLQNGVAREARAAREVILSAGALQSPQLLQLSGIGPASLLQRHGINVVHDLPGVGQNLQDHLQLRLMYRVSKPITTNDDLRTLFSQAKIGLQWLLKGTGPLGIGINQGGLFTKILPGSETPDIQFHFGTLSADMAGGKPHPWSGCTFSVCQLRPESRGTVEIRSADPMEPPSMKPNYLEAETDRICAVESIKYARRLASTNALRPYLVGEYKPGADVSTDDEILDFAREYGATIFHPTGTCKMGSDPLAVTDARLRVHGIGGLRVVDCSIMPNLVSGNTHAPAVMIAEKASDMILADSKENSIAA
ncbi:alcohol dehydrogenase acceptor [Afipia carboxidovorans OM5]|uniref:Glucose-methanol-choline oxidoreductase n=1 Tax=Afipia carboxidovorans (strain ATCC 49405 / DSM 1227 / KCTC 32145 / OM5) TaxID=504832 RepID=B6JGQ9_AFIC5|nr:choline dehydrogenase [Afipia carboxidovorans]ACI93859.1 alcohol dehydrogenase acceptor [Afipia carboxidovorans OM5]AEI02465.1 glucose-methanol-choline oxidoreductase [Afipia carboxidovorans OM4]AEI06041.1 glucose-methanol-choline oxidoreductase [Afipia carboxidovorans OM5]BEV46832.1 choline dehydrogenase [Afipia carboxidovorans]